MIVLRVQIATLEEELNNNTREEENFRTKEKALLDQLRQVPFLYIYLFFLNFFIFAVPQTNFFKIRGQLARNDTTRRALQRWLEDMRQKNEGTSEEISHAEQSALRQHDAVITQARSAQLMTQYDLSPLVD